MAKWQKGMRFRSECVIIYVHKGAVSEGHTETGSISCRWDRNLVAEGGFTESPWMLCILNYVKIGAIKTKMILFKYEKELDTLGGVWSLTTLIWERHSAHRMDFFMPFPSSASHRLQTRLHPIEFQDWRKYKRLTLRLRFFHRNRSSSNTQDAWPGRHRCLVS